MLYSVSSCRRGVIKNCLTDILFIQQPINPSDHTIAKNTRNTPLCFAFLLLASLFGGFVKQDRGVDSFYYRYGVLRFDCAKAESLFDCLKNRVEKETAEDASGLPAVFINQESSLYIRQLYRDIDCFHLRRRWPFNFA